MMQWKNQDFLNCNEKNLSRKVNQTDAGTILGICFGVDSER